MSKIGRRRLVAAAPLALAASVAPLTLAASAAGAAPARLPARDVVSPELDQLTRAWRQLLIADPPPGLAEPELDAIQRRRDALLDRILAFRARSLADVLTKLQVADTIEPFADAAEDGDVKAIWTLSAMADLERLIGPAPKTR
jgi:hypothetical protein